MALTIAIDARPLADPGGEAFAYTLNLVHSLAAVDHATTFHLYVAQSPSPELVPQAANVTVTRLDATPRIWKATALPAAAQAAGADLIHVQGLLPARAHVPVVTTIRHLDPLHQPRRYPGAAGWSWRHLLPRQIGGANAVITPWQTVSDDILAELRPAPERLHVIPYGVAPTFVPQDEAVVAAALDRCGLPQPYVLGRVHPAVGPEGIIDVWTRARDDHGLAADLVLDRGADVKGITRLEGLADESLPAILSGATASLVGYTGDAGALTLLESMACGTPVVAPQGPILRETAEGVAVLGETAEQAAGLAVLATQAEQRAARAEAGLRRARGFTWAAMAARHLAVYRQVLGA